MNWDELIQNGPSIYFPDEVSLFICEFQYQMGRNITMKETSKIRDILCDAFEELDYITTEQEEAEVTAKAMSEIQNFLQNIIDKD